MNEEKKGCIGCKFSKLGYEHSLYCKHEKINRYIKPDEYDIPCEYRIDSTFYEIKHDGIITRVRPKNE